MRPLLRSYGESSTSTLSPGTTRMKFIRIFPEMCARTSCPFWSSTLNIALGRASDTVPSTSMTSLFDDFIADHSRHRTPRSTDDGKEECTKVAQECAPTARFGPLRPARGALDDPGSVRTTAPSAVTARVCSKWADREPSAVTTV